MFSLELFKAHFEVPARGLSLMYAIQSTPSAQVFIELRTADGRSLDMTGVPPLQKRYIQPDFYVLTVCQSVKHLDACQVVFPGAEEVSGRHDDSWQIRCSRSSANIPPGTTVESVWLCCTPSSEGHAAASFAAAIGNYL